MGIENQYLGNPNLKKAFVSQEFTKENILEFQKCMNDPQYFIEKYIKIAAVTSIIKKNILSSWSKSIKLILCEKKCKNIIKDKLATKIITLNLLNNEFNFIKPSLYKIISKIQTLISAAIELPSAIPTCPKPITNAKK